MSYSFPKVYPILDASFIPAIGRAEFLRRLGSELAEAGVTLLEYRNKTGVPNIRGPQEAAFASWGGNDRSSSLGWKAGAEAELLADAEILRGAMPIGQVKLILDDRVDLVEQTGFDGVHVDAGDLKPAEARKLLGPDRIVGTLGGSVTLLPGILAEPADYFSIGPVFPTRTKQTSTPPIGMEGVRRLRAEAGTGPVLVAIGGITLATAAEALSAGASVVAIAGALFRQADPAAEFRKWLAELG
jgi:thiamine-phosphate pyrophosphorylase